MFEGFPEAVYALDGKQYVRRKSKQLPEGMNRKDFFGHKHKMAETENNQAKVDPMGICCEYLSGLC